MTCEVPLINENLTIANNINSKEDSLISEANDDTPQELDKSVFTISNRKLLQDKLSTNIHPEGWASTEKCQQLLLQYCSKSEDLENKCTILHRNLQAVKEAWDRAKVERDDALKEKENMTIKYATSEKRVLDERKMKEKFKKTCEDMTKENNIFQQKLQAMLDEKARICNMYDNKLYKLKEIQSENNRIKNDKCILENELKLCHKALEKQAELYNESQIIIKNLTKMKSDKEVCRTETMDDCKETQELPECVISENVSAKTPSECNHTRYKEIEQQNHELLQKVEKLEIEKMEITKAFKVFVEPLLQIEKNDVNIRASESDLYTIPLINESDQLKHLNQNFRVLKSKNADLEIDLETHKRREAEALLFTEQVTKKAMKLQSDYNILKKKVDQLKCEQMSMKKVNKEYQVHYNNLMQQLTEEKHNTLNESIKQTKEINLLKLELSALNTENLELKQQMHDWQEEIDIIKRKYKLAKREMQKQMESEKYDITQYSDKKSYSLIHNFPQITNKSCTNHQVEVIQPEGKIERQTFIERIVQLQRINARKSEKLDFLEYQVNALISELQKKSKLIQIYMLRNRTNALTSDMMDECKNELKTGFMASINSNIVADKKLTLAMSLQINNKLQAVLEDALLENIILKENMDTLGHEIDKLDGQLKGKKIQ